MQKNRENEHSISRLKSLLAGRYGKGLELRPLTDVSGEVPSGGHSLKGSDLHIPLRVQDAFLGTAVVPSAEDLTADHKTQISQMVRMVLEPALYRDFLDRRETNLKSLAEADLDPSNLRLFDKPEPPTNLAAPSAEPKGPKLLSNLVSLHGHDVQGIKRAALVLHEMTGRWAFAPLSDMTINSVDDLLRLGALTLFVEDVETLNESAQSLLVEYLTLRKSDDWPLIILGSAVSPEELSRRGSLMPALIAEIFVNSLELDRVPLNERSLREVMEIMFFSDL